MTKYRFLDDAGGPIDSHFEVQSHELILHSRGGTIGSPNARNTQYNDALLRMLIDRIRRSELILTEVLVDSKPARKLPVEQRAVYFSEDAGVDPQELAGLFRKRMAAVGRAPHTKQGNSTKRLRFSFAADVSEEWIVRALGRGETDVSVQEHQRLPAASLNQVKADHIFRAVERLVVAEADHSSGESSDYDLVLDSGERYSPEAVFCLAASEALGVEVRPQHIRGGPGSPCFQAIAETGFSIVPKGEEVQHSPLPTQPEERFWVEGDTKLRSHLQRERSSGLSRAKKQAFRREHGRLHCEECGLVPEDVYGEEIGEACIEVHHILPLGEDDVPRRTMLEDLICVCANCHRAIHYELRSKKGSKLI